MGGLFLIGLLALLVIKFWPFLLAALLAYLLWRFIVVPARDARAREIHERLRHERARREIDRIAIQTVRAMHAATRDGDIESSAMEADPR